MLELIVYVIAFLMQRIIWSKVSLGNNNDYFQVVLFMLFWTKSN